MKFINYSPFYHLLFESRTPDDQPFGVLVTTGVFRIVPGGTLLPVREQKPVHLHDEYRDKQGSSSLRREANLAPFKPATDIHIDAIAYAPGGRPSQQWPIRVSVGKVSKELWIRGPHQWLHRKMVGWTYEKPAPCLQVPVSYEHAFGGSYQVANKLIYCARNPVGTGWIPPQAPTDIPISAPQVVACDEPKHTPHKEYIPQGLGPMPPNWEPRLAFAGTFDEKWKQKRWPCLPADFQWKFYNSAHPDLIYPGYMEGGEALEFIHLNSYTSVLSTYLPRYGIYNIVKYSNGARRAEPLHLDTIHVDLRPEAPEEQRVYLTWRGAIPFFNAADTIQLCMRDLASKPHSPSKAKEEVAYGG